MREVAEEVGIPDAKLEKIRVIKREGANVFANVYILRDFDPSTSPVKLQADEVDEVYYWSKEEIMERMSNENHKIKPGSVSIF